jgi:hypothetical protein
MAWRLRRIASIWARKTAISPRENRLTKEDIDWLRKLRQAKASNQLSADIPTSVVRRLTQLACAEVRGGRYAITYRGRDELIERERELN